MISLGFHPALVDWIWIQTLQVMGGRNYAPELIPQTRNFYDLATDLDPRFYELYEHSGVLFSLFFKSPDDAIYFFEKGIRHLHPSWTHPYTLHLLLFYEYAFQRKDWESAKRHYIQAATMPNAPENLRLALSWLQEPHSEKRLAKQVLNALILTIDDELIKKEYQKELKKYD
jgi:hypothetical protein